MISKRDVAKTAGNLNATLVDHTLLLSPAQKAALRAAKGALVDLMRKL